MNKAFGTSTMRRGFSLAELIAALTIGAMVLASVLSVYSRAERSADAVTRRLDGSKLPYEVLQRIAEDLDGIVEIDKSTELLPPLNKYDHGFPSAKLTIRKIINDRNNKEVVFEEITWQSRYDLESDVVGLVLYRSHSGIGLEDKLLDKRKEDWERELFVPICNGVTFFEIRAVSGDEPIEKWDGSVPPGIAVTISFAEPFEKVDGTLDVPDDQKITRTIAIDRTRKIRFAVARSEYQKDGKEKTDEEIVEEEIEEEKVGDSLPGAKTLPAGDQEKPKKSK